MDSQCRSLVVAIDKVKVVGLRCGGRDGAVRISRSAAGRYHRATEPIRRLIEVDPLAALEIAK